MQQQQLIMRDRCVESIQLYILIINRIFDLQTNNTKTRENRIPYDKKINVKLKNCSALFIPKLLHSISKGPYFNYVKAYWASYMVSKIVT